MPNTLPLIPDLIGNPDSCLTFPISKRYLFRYASPMISAAYVYILASKRNGTLYTGATRDLVRRIYQHKSHQTDGFTHKYSVTQLVYYEKHDRLDQAIQREKQIKKWNRAWKLQLIEKRNPDWQDLYSDICQ